MGKKDHLLRLKYPFIAGCSVVYLQSQLVKRLRLEDPKFEASLHKLVGPRMKILKKEKTNTNG